MHYFDPQRLFSIAQLLLNKASLTIFEEEQLTYCINMGHGALMAHCNRDPYLIEDNEYSMPVDSIIQCLDFCLIVGFVLPIFSQITANAVGIKSEAFNSLSVSYDPPQIRPGSMIDMQLQRFVNIGCA